jgi:hypothetical protein
MQPDAARGLSSSLPIFVVRRTAHDGIAAATLRCVPP